MVSHEQYRPKPVPVVLKAYLKLYLQDLQILVPDVFHKERKVRVRQVNHSKSGQNRHHAYSNDAEPTYSLSTGEQALVFAGHGQVHTHSPQCEQKGCQKDEGAASSPLQLDTVHHQDPKAMIVGQRKDEDRD
eukprot:scaffold8161_cov430-Prasinococcus_capsulatus_cf.AAC.4